MPGESVRTISPLLPKGQHPLQNRSIFLPLPHCHLHWGRALSCPTGTVRAQPMSSGCSSARERSGLCPGDPARLSAAPADSPAPRPRLRGCRLCPTAPPGLGDTERALKPGAGGTAALADRGELASPGKGKPRHITETRAPLPPARAAAGEERAARPEGAARPRSPSLRPRPEAGDPQNPREKPSCPGLCSGSGCPRRRGETKAGAPRHPARPEAGRTAAPGPAALARTHALAHGDNDERGYLVHPIPHGLSDPHASTAGEAVGRCCQRRVGVHGTVLAEGGLGTG